LRDTLRVFDYRTHMKKFLVTLTLLLLAGCAGDATKLTPTTYNALDGWGDDAHAAAYQLFTDSCGVNAARKNAYRAKAEGAVGARENWNRVCRIAEQNPAPSNEMARQFFESNFTPYKVETESKSTGTLTGYYEPILNGSRQPRPPYLTPVHGVPNDLGSRKPYFTREEIVAGALKGRAPVLLYVDDPIMLAFLHIQGSGKVKLPDGSLVGLQYAAQNGHPFVPIGRVLKERGELPKPSMQGIRDWLRANPNEAEEVMNMNPSYVFFSLAPGDEMARGAIGLPLTPLRSIAIDDDRAAYGVPTYIDTYVTEQGSSNQLPLKRLFVSQDTGGALKSPHRGDIFFGRGEREEWQAGHQNAQGNVYWLLPVAEGVMLRGGAPMSDEEKREALKEQSTVSPINDAVPTAPDIDVPAESPAFEVAPDIVAPAP
jgi:membrane-bound lytic murein transglycosylase A